MKKLTPSVVFALNWVGKPIIKPEGVLKEIVHPLL